MPPDEETRPSGDAGAGQVVGGTEAQSTRDAVSRQPVTEPVRCLGCNRPLRTALAVAAGYGPTCAMDHLRARHRARRVVPVQQLELPGLVGEVS